MNSTLFKETAKPTKEIHLGDVIKKRRLHAGLSQSQLSILLTLNYMFTPTKEELEELEFSEDSLDYYPMYSLNTNDYIMYNTDNKTFGYSVGLFIVNIYPQSLDDLKTLIRILTPKE